MVSWSFDAIDDSFDPDVYAEALAAVMQEEGEDFVAEDFDVEAMTQPDGALSVTVTLTSDDEPEAEDARSILQAQDALSVLADEIEAISAPVTLLNPTEPTVATEFYTVELSPPPPLPSLGLGEMYQAQITFSFLVTSGTITLGRRLQTREYTTADIEAAVVTVLEREGPANGYGDSLQVEVFEVADTDGEYDIEVKVDGDHGATVKDIVDSLNFDGDETFESAVSEELGAESVELTEPATLVFTVIPGPSPPPAAAADGDDRSDDITDTGANVETEDESKGGVAPWGIALIVILVLLCVLVVCICPAFMYAKDKKAKKTKELTVGGGAKEEGPVESTTQV